MERPITTCAETTDNTQTFWSVFVFTSSFCEMTYRFVTFRTPVYGRKLYVAVILFRSLNLLLKTKLFKWLMLAEKKYKMSTEYSQVYFQIYLVHCCLETSVPVLRDHRAVTSQPSVVPQLFRIRHPSGRCCQRPVRYVCTLC